MFLRIPLEKLSFKFNFFLTLLFYFLLSLSFFHDYAYNGQENYSFITFFLFLIFFLHIFLIFIFNKKNFFYYLLFFSIFTAGFYIFNHPIADELIFCLAALAVIINFFFRKKMKFNFKFENIFFLLLIFIAFIYSIKGLNYSFKSIRYVALYFSIFIVFLYTISDSFPKINKTLLIYAIYYSSIGYLIIEIILWIIKFYYFKDFFQIQNFLGSMQPAKANSATPYTNIIGISGTFISLYVLRFYEDYIKPLLFILLLFITMHLQDSQTIEFLLLFFIIALLFTKFNYNKVKFSILAISLCSLLHILLLGPNAIKVSSSWFISDLLPKMQLLSESEEKILYKGKEMIAPKDNQGLRKLYILSSIYYIKEENIKNKLFGCGLYSYWECNHYLYKIANKYQIFNLNIPVNKTTGKKIRPTSVASVVTEFGLLFVLLSFFLLIYCYFKKIKTKFISFKNFEISVFYFYNIIIFIFWSLFGFLEDISYLYLLTMPNLIYYNLFKKSTLDLNKKYN